MSNFLTFELDEKGDLLEIHGNNEGLRSLLGHINDLLKIHGNEHIHLMIPSWGGCELSEQKQCENNDLIAHVKIFKWEN